MAIQERERVLLRLLRHAGHYPLANQKILEVGCGEGFWLRSLVHWGAQPHRVLGIDLLPERVARARATCAAAPRLWCAGVISATNCG